MASRIREQPYCLVLGGGGAKGVYHIGAWQALKELKIPVCAFIGNSIGAIVAGFLAQGADTELERIGESISLDSVLKLPEELQRPKDPRAALKGVANLYGDFVKRGGLDTGPLRSLVNGTIDEGKLRASGTDLGIVTVSLSDFKAREVFVEDMEDGRVVDYLMASSAFPGFERPEIEGKRYVDGGLYDNVPYAMARRRGYRKIIVLDISGAGVNRRPNIAGSQTVWVKNSIDMGGVLDFDPRFLRNFKLLGYLDVMRSFGELIGYSYFVKYDPKAEARFLRDHRGFLTKGEDFPEEMRYDRRLLLKSLECAATILRVERIKSYTYDELASAIAEEKRKVEAQVASFLHGSQGPLPMLMETITSGHFVERPYFYSLLANRLAEDQSPTIRRGIGGARKALGRIFPALAAGDAYLSRAT